MENLQMSMIYFQRLTRPIKGNKYYITTSNGGYSKAIKGKCKATGKPDTQCDALANCVGYAYGRFHEIIGDIKMSYLSPVNAELFPEYAKNCKTGSTPKVGSIIVWQKGTLGSSDGAGHVAIVERIINNNQIIISQSGYNSTPFWTETINKGDGNWRATWMSKDYKFRCFIYNPIITDDTRSVIKKGDNGVEAKLLQQKLNEIGYNLTVDGLFGPSTDKAVRDFQKSNGLTVDGSVGENTWNKLINLTTKPAGVVDFSFNLKGKNIKAWCMLLNNQRYVRLLDIERGL